MKIAIIGDTHFGSGLVMGRLDPKTQLNTRLLDIISTFDGIVDNFIKYKVDLVVITGDVFETRYPTPAQLNAFSKSVKRATNAGLPVVIIAGNHDQQRTINTTTIDIFKSLEVSGISIYSTMDVHNIAPDLNLVLMPYKDRRMIGAKTNNDAILEIEEDLQEILKTLSGKKIVIGHFMIGQPVKGLSADCFSINELVLPLSIFEGADAVIMGHIHKHQILQENPLIVYSGSMDKKDFGEKDNHNVSLILDTDDLNNPTIISNNTRDLWEINLDYAGEKKPLKNKITEKIITAIGEFDKENPLTQSIIKVSISVKENDLFYIDEDKIKKFILSKNVRYLAPIQTKSVNTRQLRNKNITENMDEDKAMIAYINGLKGSDQMKKQLIKYATNIINEVKGK